MALNVPAGYWHCKLRWRLNGDLEEVVCTIGVTGNSPGDRDIVEVAHAVYNAWEGAWPQADLANVWGLVGCDATEGSASGDGVVGSWDEVTQGTATWACTPSNCALLIKKRTALGGRPNVGRMFLPAGYLYEEDIDPLGMIGGGSHTSQQANANQFYENLIDSTTAVGQPIADFQPVLFHNDASREPTPITSFAVDRLIATQRQRMRR